MSQRGMTISEAAEKTGLSADTLRYYEKIGLLPPAARDEGGRRIYGGEMLRRAAVIKECREFGLPLEYIRRFLPPRAGGAAEDEARAALLAAARADIEARIERLRRQLIRIDESIRFRAAETDGKGKAA